MKPGGSNSTESGLLEYLEEIIGSSTHVADIERLGQELEIENEKRVAMTNRVKASIEDLSNMEEGKQLAMDYLRDERQYYKYLNFSNYIELSATIKKFNELNTEVNKNREVAQDKKEKKRQIVEENKAIIDSITKQQDELKSHDEELQNLDK